MIDILLVARISKLCKLQVKLFILLRDRMLRLRSFFYYFDATSYNMSLGAKKNGSLQTSKAILALDARSSK